MKWFDPILVQYINMTAIRKLTCWYRSSWSRSALNRPCSGGRGALSGRSVSSAHTPARRRWGWYWPCRRSTGPGPPPSAHQQILIYKIHRHSCINPQNSAAFLHKCEAAPDIIRAAENLCVFAGSVYLGNEMPHLTFLTPKGKFIDRTCTWPVCKLIISLKPSNMILTKKNIMGLKID